MAAQYHNRLTQERGESGAQHSMMESCREASQDLVRDYPTAAVVAVFGLGLGIGALIGSMLAEPAGLRRRTAAEHLGRRVLDSLAEMMPDAVQRYLPD